MAVILLLEDDENIAFGIQTGLNRSGYEVMWCKSLQEAQTAYSTEI